MGFDATLYGTKWFMEGFQERVSHFLICFMHIIDVVVLLCALLKDRCFT